MQRLSERSFIQSLMIPLTGRGELASNAANVALVLGILLGVGGWFLYGYEACTHEPIGDFCLEYARPYEGAGLMTIGIGGILIIVGIVLYAMAQRTTPTAPTPPQPQAPATGKYCTNCGTLNPFEARYCNSCGNELTGGAD